ncbi:MAG: DUF2807 domain-containing protein [Brevinematales bacterium]|nr:DUF2807 domain-containing protein [Brevinematales bacterium]
MNITIGDVQKVEISIDDNLMDSITSKVHGEVLYIGNNNGIDCPQLVVNITMPVLKKIELSGDGNISVFDPVTNDQLTIILDGSGTIDFHGNPKSLIVSLSGSGIVSGDIRVDKGNFQISGSGSVMIKGSAKETTVGINAMGNFLGKDFCSDNAYVEIWGNGGCEIEVSEKLKSKIMGTGNIKVKGEPKFDNNIIGPGQIIQIK